MRKNIIVSLMIAFLFATTFSAGLSYSLSHYINLQRIVKQLREDEINMAQSISDICKDYDADVFELARQFSSSVYTVFVMSDEQIASIPEETATRINNGEIITNSKFLDFDTDCMFRANNNIMSIKLNPQSDIIKSFGDRIGLVLSLTLILSALLMFFMSR